MFQQISDSTDTFDNLGHWRPWKSLKFSLTLAMFTRCFFRRPKVGRFLQRFGMFQKLKNRFRLPKRWRIEESIFFGFDGKVALQTLFLRLLLERSFTELGAPWLQKKTLNRYTRYTSWSLIQVRTGLSVSGGCCSTGSFNVQGGLKNAWNTLMSLDLWGFNGLLWMECGWELSRNAGKALFALPVSAMARFSTTTRGCCVKSLFTFRRSHLPESNLKCSK